MRTDEALRYAQERDLDLVEVAPEAQAARLPRARLLEVQVRAGPEAEGRRASTSSRSRSARSSSARRSPQHDYDTKKGHVERFLKRKDKVKITIMFRGREVAHPERGQMILDRLAEELAELAVVEQRPNQDGRNMTMMLGPSKAVLSGQIDEQPTGDVPCRRGRRRSADAVAPRRTRRRGRAAPAAETAEAAGDAAPLPPRRRPRAAAEAPPRPRGPADAEAARARPTARGRPPSARSREPRRGVASGAEAPRRRQKAARRRPPAAARREPHRPPDARRVAPHAATPKRRVSYTAPSAMPKMKTHSGAKKRFKLTANGKVRGRHSFTSHILEKKSPKRKRHLGNPTILKPR